MLEQITHFFSTHMACFIKLNIRTKHYENTTQLVLFLFIQNIAYVPNSVIGYLIL